MVLNLFFIGCRKEQKVDPSQANSTISPSAATSYYGELSASLVLVTGGMPILYPYCEAYFSSIPLSAYNLSNGTLVGEVKLNDTRFKYSGNYKYTDTTNNISFPTANWQVIGSGTIPSFNYSNPDLLPSYSGFDSIPKSFVKSQSQTIPIYGVSGATVLKITLSDGLSGTGHSVEKTVASTLTAVSFSATEMNGLTSGTSNATISVECIKRNVQSVYGKPICFNTVYQVLGAVTIQ